MMLQGVKNILFDLGGVLFHIDYQRTIDAFKKLGITDFEKHFTQYQQNDLFDSFETGKISSSIFVKELKEFLPSCSDQEIINAWNAMLIGLPQEYLKLLEELAKKYRLFLLSNANQIHIQFVNDSDGNQLENYMLYYGWETNKPKNTSVFFHVEE